MEPVSIDQDSDDWGDVDESPVQETKVSLVEAKTRFCLSRCLFVHAKQLKGQPLSFADDS